MVVPNLIFENLIERHAELNPENWDLRWHPRHCNPICRSPGQPSGSTLWVDATGLVGVSQTPLGALGVPGDVAGRLARGVSGIASTRRSPTS